MAAPRRALLVLVTLTVACQHRADGMDTSGQGDLAMAAGDDLATPADGGADAKGGADMGAAGDMGPAACSPPAGDGAPTLIAGLTRPQNSRPLLAFDGVSTMIAWTVGSRNGGTSFAHTAWAEVKDGAVVAAGTLPGRMTMYGQLLALKGKFYYFDGDSYYQPPNLYVFDGTQWTAVPGVDTAANAGGRVLTAVAVSGPNMVLISASNVPGAESVWAAIFDGTTLGTFTQLNTHSFAALASDGAGGFGVASTGKSGATTALYFSGYDGNAWSADQLLAIPDGGGFLWTVDLAGTGSTWCVVTSGSNITPTAYIGSGTTFTTATFANFPKGTARVAAANGTFAIGGRATVAVDSAGTWAQQTLAGSGDPQGLLPFGNGYVFVYGDANGALSASIYDGMSWGAPTTLSAKRDANSAVQVSVGGTDIAVAFGNGAPQVVAYDSGTWAAPVELTTAASQGPNVLVAGASIVAAYPELGMMRSRARDGGTWSAATALPSAGSTGMVETAALARNADGHALAVWSQWDIDQLGLYAAEYGCQGWGAPVSLGPGSAPTVAAAGSTFVVGSLQGTTASVASWTGSGLSTATSLGAAKDLRLASDGAAVAAVWTDASGYLWSATSADGATWTAAEKIESSSGRAIKVLAGGPAGVLEGSSTSGGYLQARVWHDGAWSAAASVPSGSFSPCHGAVGDTTALVACSYSMTDAKLFANGAWSDVPAGSYDEFALATDGTDYRLDGRDSTTGELQSPLFHAGAWSSPMSQTNVKLPSSPASDFAVAGVGGSWSFVYLDDGWANLRVAHATGDGAYSAGTQLFAMDLNFLAGVTFVSWPGEADAVWTSPSATSMHMPLLYVSLGL